MRKLTLLIGFALLSLFSTKAFCQSEKTLYQKKREALRYKLFGDLGFPISLVNSTSNVGDFFDAFMYKMKGEREIALLVKYQEDLKAAESLKSSAERKPLGKGEPTPEQIFALSENESPRQPFVREDNTVYNFTSAMEAPPAYPGGMERFHKFLSDNIKYPEEAKTNNIKGNVIVSFIVEKDGSLTDIKVDKKLGYGTDEEAVRVLKMSKRWNPSIQNGKLVRVRLNIPIKFPLQEVKQ